MLKAGRTNWSSSSNSSTSQEFLGGAWESSSSPERFQHFCSTSGSGTSLLVARSGFRCQKTTRKIIKRQNNSVGSDFWVVTRPICVKRFDPASFPGFGPRFVLGASSKRCSRSVPSRAELETARLTKEREFTWRAGCWKGGEEHFREFRGIASKKGGEQQENQA